MADGEKMAETGETGSRDDRIRERAYQIWEAEGRPQGKAQTHWEQASTELEAEPARKVRPAGKKAMKNPPKDWSIVDEQSDESFPASDPPGNY